MVMPKRKLLRDLESQINSLVNNGSLSAKEAKQIKLHLKEIQQSLLKGKLDQVANLVVDIVSIITKKK